MNTEHINFRAGKGSLPPRGTTLMFSLVLLLLYACDIDSNREKGNGIIVSENYEVKSFNTIAAAGNFEIILQKADQEGVQVIADENLMQYIDVDVQDRTLNLQSTRPITSDEGIKAYISYNELDALEIGGASKVTADNVIKERSLDIAISGASLVDLELDVRSLEVHLSGAGLVTLAGKAKIQDFEMSGAGNLEASELIGERCAITISGLGGAEVYATETLEATVSGVGGVEYFGHPAEVQSNVSGLGKVKAAGRE